MPRHTFKMNYALFGINSLFALLFLHAGVVSIAVGFVGQGRPFEFLGAIIFFPIPVAVLLLEWGGTIRKKHKYLKTLGILQLFFCGFLLFGLAKSAGEAIQDWDEESIEILICFGLICGLLAAYSGFSGVYRLRLYRRIERGLAADKECVGVEETGRERREGRK